jgi:hypothetical protein
MKVGQETRIFDLIQLAFKVFVPAVTCASTGGKFTMIGAMAWD